MNQAVRPGVKALPGPSPPSPARSGPVVSHSSTTRPSGASTHVQVHERVPEEEEGPREPLPRKKRGPRGRRCAERGLDNGPSRRGPQRSASIMGARVRARDQPANGEDGRQGHWCPEGQSQRRPCTLALWPSRPRGPLPPPPPTVARLPLLVPAHPAGGAVGREVFLWGWRPEGQMRLRQGRPVLFCGPTDEG